MQEVFNRYISFLKAERNASTYTIRNYSTDLVGTRLRGSGKGFFQFLGKKKISSLEDVDKQIIREYIGWLMDQGVVKPSIARKLSAIRSFYRYLLREGLLARSPIPVGTSGRKGERSAISPKLDKRLPTFLTPGEVERLLKGPDTSKPGGKRDRAILELFYAAGLRVSELAQLDLGQIDLVSHEVRVTGKGSKERVTLMGTPAARALDDYIGHGRPLLLKSRRNHAVFLSTEGRRLIVRSIQKLIKKYADAAGLEKRVYPHVLRHTFATHLLDLRVVQELLGHADLSTTQIYTHVSKVQARKTYMLTHPLAVEPSLREEGYDDAADKPQT